MASEVEETIKRIQSQKGVIGVVIVNSEGVPIKSSFDNGTALHYAGLLKSIIDKSRSAIRELDPNNDLTFLRLKSKKHEIMIAPEKEYNLIVVQNPSE